MAGLTANGFEILTLPEIEEALSTALKAELGATLDLNPETSVLGVIKGILAEREAVIWEGLQEFFASNNPNSAQGAALDSLCAITGTTRNNATFSTVKGVLVGASGIVVPAGFRAAVQGTQGAQFELDNAATLLAVSAWAPTTSYAAGAFARNGGNVYRAVVGGTSAGSGGPSGEGSSVVDGSVTWRFCGTGTGALEAAFSALDSGPVQALAFTLTEIQTPISNLDAVLNFLDAVLGSFVETDSELRLRRKAELFQSGASTVDSIRAAILAVSGVTSCSVRENVTDTTDGEFILPHSFEAIVEGGQDQQIADAIFSVKPAGVGTTGTENIIVTDSQGVSHSVDFTRPTLVDIFVVIDVKKTASFPADGENQIKNALVTRGNVLQVSQDVVSSFLKVAPFGVAGVIDVSSCFIGKVPGPTDENTVSIANKQRARFNSANVTVNLTTGSL